MKKILLAALFSLMSAISLADDIAYTWTHSTTRTDGTPIVGTRSYVLEVSKSDVVVATATPTGTDHTITGLSSGTYSARIATVESGRQGPWSPSVTTIIDAPPATPGSLRGVVITVNVTIQ